MSTENYCCGSSPINYVEQDNYPNNVPSMKRTSYDKKFLKEYDNLADKAYHYEPFKHSSHSDWEVMPYRTAYDKRMNALYDPLAQKAYHYLE